jgi:DNA-binding MarR family transcriptional regulator
MSLRKALQKAATVSRLTIRALLALTIAIEAGGRIDMGELVKEARLSGPAVSRAVDNLCVNGFTKRVRNEDHGGRVFVVVSKNGKQFVDSLSGDA